MIALLVFSLSMGPPPPLQDISQVILSIVGFLMALVFAFFFALLMLFLAFNFLIWLVLVPLALLFRILNLAPRGIVTAIGLIIAAAGVIEPIQAHPPFCARNQPLACHPDPGNHQDDHHA